jgi:large conductance mechanosensitive channel
MKKPDIKKGGSAVKKIAGEFKAFAIKGNVIDLAVGVIIGGAFSKIIASIVNDIVMPFIGMFLGGVDFKNWVIDLPRFFNQPKPIEMNVGIFINTVIEFLILAIIVFLFVKGINRLKRKQEEAPPAPAAPTKEELLLTEIRDILKQQKDK